MTGTNRRVVGDTAASSCRQSSWSSRCSAGQLVESRLSVEPSNGRSRAGLITTTGTCGFERPPITQSGMSAPQSSGAVAAPGSLAPKLTPTTGIRSSCRAVTTATASSRSTGHDSSTAGASQSASVPATFPARTTAKCPSTCTLCGVTTMVASGRAPSKRRPSSSIARCVCSAPGIAAPGASGTASVPCGAIAAKQITEALRSSRRGSSAPTRRGPTDRRRFAHG